MTDHAEHLAAVRAARRTVDQAIERFDKTGERARLAGCSWRDLGAAGGGVSPNTAWKWWRHVEPRVWSLDALRQSRPEAPWVAVDRALEESAGA